MHSFRFFASCISGDQTHMAGRPAPLPGGGDRLSSGTQPACSSAIRSRYFAELGGSTSLADGAAPLRLRRLPPAYWKGDDGLFRPLAICLARCRQPTFLVSPRLVERREPDASRSLVALFLFRLLATIRPSPFAFAAALLFVVMKPPLELVLWNHLGGYLLASALPPDRAPRVREGLLRDGSTAAR